MQEDREAVAPVIVRLLSTQSEACPPGAAAAQTGPRIGDIPSAVHPPTALRPCAPRSMLPVQGRPCSG